MITEMMREEMFVPFDDEESEDNEDIELRLLFLSFCFKFKPQLFNFRNSSSLSLFIFGYMLCLTFCCMRRKGRKMLRLLLLSSVVKER